MSHNYIGSRCSSKLHYLIILYKKVQTVVFYFKNVCLRFLIKERLQLSVDILVEMHKDGEAVKKQDLGILFGLFGPNGNTNSPLQLQLDTGKSAENIEQSNYNGGGERL